MTLKELFSHGGREKYHTDKGDHHSYFETYDKIFERFKDKECNIFECGFATGGDLKLFEDYFTKGKILGIDIVGDKQIIEHGTTFSGRVKTVEFDLNRLSYAFFLEQNFIPDIAIDDSTHFLHDQLHFVSTMYSIVNKGGLIIVEDVANLKERLPYFKGLNYPFEVVDLREERKGTTDNALIIYRK